MKKENVDRNIYYGLRKDLGEFTSNSGIPIEVVHKMFDVFDLEMTKYVLENNETVNMFIASNKEKVKVK